MLLPQQVSWCLIRLSVGSYRYCYCIILFVQNSGRYRLFFGEYPVADYCDEGIGTEIRYQNHFRYHCRECVPGYYAALDACGRYFTRREIYEYHYRCNADRYRYRRIALCWWKYRRYGYHCDVGDQIPQCQSGAGIDVCDFCVIA